MIARVPGRPAAGRGVLSRPRSFQGRQRHARPFDRRRTDPQRHAAAHQHVARRRSRGPARRRRIRRHHHGRPRPGHAAIDRAADHFDPVRALYDRRQYHRHWRQHRDCVHRPAFRRSRDRHHALRRHGALPRQERRPQPRLHLRHRDGCRSHAPQAARTGFARRDRDRSARRRLSADRQRQRRENRRRRGAGALGSIPSAVSSAQSSSFRSPSTPGSSSSWASGSCAAPAATARHGRGFRSRSMSRRCSSARPTFVEVVERILAETEFDRQPARARADRKHADRQRGDRRIRHAAAARRSACGLRSTISAPAIRACSTCAASRSTSSRSTAASCSASSKATDAAAIVHAIVSLGRGLGMKVTAEGVENAEQHLFLRAAGVHFMQGYRFGKPCSAAEITTYLGQARRLPPHRARRGRGDGKLIALADFQPPSTIPVLRHSGHCSRPAKPAG